MAFAVTLHDTDDSRVAAVYTGGAGTDQYRVSDVVGGDYWYKISATDYGTIYEPILIPEDFPVGTTSKHTEVTIYPAADSTIITIVDDSDAKIEANVDLKINGVSYTLISSNEFSSLIDISTRPDGSVIEFVDTATPTVYEPLKLKKLFPIATNALEQILFPKFTLEILFKLTSSFGVDVTRFIDNATFYYIGDIALGDNAKIEEFIIPKGYNGFTSRFVIPNTIAQNGTLYLKSINSSLYRMTTNTNILVTSASASSLTKIFIVEAIPITDGLSN